MVIQKERVKRILLIRIGALGDVLLTTAFIRGLRKAFPDADIVYAVSEEASPFLEHNPYLSQILPLKISRDHPFISLKGSKKFLYAAFCLLGQRGRLQGEKFFLKDKDRQERRVFDRVFSSGEFDLAIDLHLGHNPFTSKILGLSGAPYRVGGRANEGVQKSYNIACDDTEHGIGATQKFNQILHVLGVPDDGEGTEIFLTQEEKERASFFLKGKVRPEAMIVGLHPGTTVAGKLWENSRWAKVADTLVSEYRANVLLFHAPGEEKFVRDILGRMKSRAILMPATDLRHYAALVSKCHYFISLDSAPLHIAQSVGVPVLSLFLKGAGDARVWFSYQKGFALQKEVIEVSDVLEAFDAMVRPQPGAQVSAGQGMMIQKERIERILLIRFDKLGDLLLITPFIRALKKSFPSAEIVCVISSNGQGLLLGNPYVTKIISVDRMGLGDVPYGIRRWCERSYMAAYNLSWRFGLLGRAVRKWLFRDLNFRKKEVFREVARMAQIKRFDMAVDFHGGLDPMAFKIACLSGAAYRVGGGEWAPDLNDFYNIRWTAALCRGPILGRYSSIFPALGVQEDGRRTEIFLDEAERKEGEDFFREYAGPHQLIIGLHPGCASKEKLWDFKKWAALADILGEQEKAKVFIFQGPHEEPSVSAVTSHMKHKPFIVPLTSIRKYAALVSNCDYFVCLDSAPLHIAQAMGVPAIGLFLGGKDFSKVWFDYDKGAGLEMGAEDGPQKVLDALHALAARGRSRP